MEIKIDADAAAAIASAAIFDSLGEETREGIVKDAIKYLLAPQDNGGYGRPKTSPLQDSFNNAISVAAQKLVHQTLDEDPRVKDEIKKLLGPLIEQAIVTEDNEYRSGLTTAMGQALGSWLVKVAKESREY